jgi:hypothetical protein
LLQIYTKAAWIFFSLLLLKHCKTSKLRFKFKALSIRFFCNNLNSIVYCLYLYVCANRLGDLWLNEAYKNINKKFFVDLLRRWCVIAKCMNEGKMRKMNMKIWEKRRRLRMYVKYNNQYYTLTYYIPFDILHYNWNF